CSAGINHSAWNKCHANIRRGYCLSEQGGVPSQGNRGSAAAKMRSTDRADEELLAGTNLAPVHEEPLATANLFPYHASLAANGESRLSIHKHPCRAWDNPRHKRKSKELVHHLAYSEQE